MRSARRKVIFVKQDGTAAVTNARQSPRSASSRTTSTPTGRMAGGTRTGDPLAIPLYFTSPPIIRDSLTTASLSVQEDTVNECLPLINAVNETSSNTFDFNVYGVRHLDREQHVNFLRDALGEYPPQFVGVDASRPWMVYWGLMGLYLLGEDVQSYRTRVIHTFIPMQNPTGGFGGGQGQYSHLAGSYATVLSFALVGGQEAFSFIDREKMWHWLGRLKQPDGGFQLCEGGEEDVRGAYCAMVILSLLNLPLELPEEAPARASGLETFGDGLGGYLSRCQTYEGGFSEAPGNEAHGGYAFCSLACLCLLGEPHKMFEKYLDVDRLLSWLSSRQYAPEGGFAGRTNKLVDGCYCHWVGGCWPLVEAALRGPQSEGDFDRAAAVGSLYSREGHTRYVLNCCQESTGGLRDKPSKRPDSYHTCYTLAGLSSLQYFHYYTHQPTTTSHFASAFAWSCRAIESDRRQAPDGNVFDEADRLQPVHPVYILPHRAVLDMRAWAEKQGQLGIQEANPAMTSTGGIH